MLLLSGKHNDVFHCFYKGEFLVSSNASLAQTLPHFKLTLIKLACWMIKPWLKQYNVYVTLGTANLVL